MVGSSPSSESEPKAVTKSAMSLSPLSLALLLLSKFIAHGDDGDDGRMRDTRIAAGAAQGARPPVDTAPAAHSRARAPQRSKSNDAAYACMYPD